MKYPTFKIRGSPTPNDTLWVCDKCGKAEWGHDLTILICYTCKGKKAKSTGMRMRKATEAETLEARKAITKIIGD